MSDLIKVEALIASPPTSKCQETIGVLEELVRRHPDELSLLVFKRGIDFFPENATCGMKALIQKGSPVPACVINGMFFSSNLVPRLEDLEARVQEVILHNSEK
jgi:hypothetical protein